MVLKTENEELHYRGKPLVVPLAYHECASCGFDIVSHELMVKRNAIVKEARRTEQLGESDETINNS